MKLTVKDVDYKKLVEKMNEFEFLGMDIPLSAQLLELGTPSWENEITYFWKALFNAARENDKVWAWLATRPFIRIFDPSEGVHVSGQFVEPWALPEIGGPDDKPFKKKDPPLQWPAEPTIKNFLVQCQQLDARLQAEALNNPNNRCKNIQEYVATFFYSETARTDAQIQITELGYHALATIEGIQWLMDQYPPQK